MHAPYDKHKISSRSESTGGAGFLILTAMAVVFLALGAFHPKAPLWISQAAEAEFGLSGFSADNPVQTAEPDMAVPIETVRAY